MLQRLLMLIHGTERDAHEVMRRGYVGQHGSVVGIGRQQRAIASGQPLSGCLDDSICVVVGLSMSIPCYSFEMSDARTYA